MEVYNFLNNRNINYFKKSNIVKNKWTENIQQNKKTLSSYSNPKYYQALNNISFGSSKKDDFVYVVDIPHTVVFLNLPFVDDKTLTPVQIDNNIVQKYLTDDNDNISVEYLKRFSSEVRKNIMNAHEESVQNFIKYFKNGENLEGVKKIVNDYMLESCFSSSLKDIKNEAINKARDFFVLSKTKEGYDFSDSKEKKEAIKLLQDIRVDYSSNKNAYEDVISCIEKELDNGEDGSLDLILKFLDIVSCLGFFPNRVDKILDLLKQYGNKDENTIKFLVYCIDECDLDDDDFEEYFSKGFNNETKKYDENLAQHFYSVSIVLDEMLSDVECDNNLSDSLPSNKEFLIDYFDNYIDNKTGKIKDGAPDIYEFTDMVRKDIENFLSNS